MQLQESGSEGSAHGLATGIRSSRVLGSKKHEVGMWLHNLVQLWDK